MSVSWSDLTFTPSSEALAALRDSWSWLLPESFTPHLFSVFGDVFYSDCTGHVFWLNTGTAVSTRIADSVAAFQQALGTDQSNDWFLPALVGVLHQAGKIPDQGECYTYAILPIFAEGKFEEWNFAPVPANEHFAATASVHRQIAGLGDGTHVKLSARE